MNLRTLYSRYAMFIRYVVIGVLTTLVNLLIFFVLDHLDVNYLLANTVAWFGSVVFAFFTNKTIVFRSQTDRRGAIIELILFFVLRGVSLALDDGLMYLGISILALNKILVKLVVQVIVIVSNYLFSKIIFSHSKEA